MKNLFLVILFTLLFTACRREQVKTETRVYELTYVDGTTETFTFDNVDINAKEGIDHSFGGYYFYLISCYQHAQVEAIIRFKRLQ